jgi:hypothetical protein
MASAEFLLILIGGYRSQSIEMLQWITSSQVLLIN